MRLVASFLNSEDSNDQSVALESIRETLDHSALDESQLEQFLSNLTPNSHEQKGIDDSFLDTLERVSIKKIKPDETCPICTNDYHSDPYPLIVRLPCNSKHVFDMDCIAPWLKTNTTCPLCRVDVTAKKPTPVIVDSEEEEEAWDMYG